MHDLIVQAEPDPLPERTVYAVGEVRYLPQGPLTVKEEQDHDCDSLGGHVLRVVTAASREEWVLASDVTDQNPAAVTA
jgi:hypothetical protein